MIEFPEFPSPSYGTTMMTAMVFFDVDHRPTLPEAKAFIERICAFLQEQPTHAQIGNGYGKGERHPKFSKLDDVIATGKFNDFKYVSGVSYFAKKDLNALCLNVSYVQIYGRQIHICFRSERSQAVDLRLLLDEVHRTFPSDFAIARQALFKDAPANIDNMRLDWFQSEYLAGQTGKGKRFKDGFFRGVYPWHYLTPAHLDQPIEGMRFADWVASTQNTVWRGLARPKGRLTPLNNGGAIWEVAADDMEDLRARMLGAGLLIAQR